MTIDLQAAHERSIRHRAEIEASSRCGCFHCLKIYPPSAITDWTDTREPLEQQTALCPRCGIDAVIGDKSGLPISEEFLRTMKQAWF